MRDAFRRNAGRVRQIPHFVRHDGKRFAVFLRPARLNRRIQRQQPRLLRDVLNDGNLADNLLHGDHRFGHHFAAFFRIRERLLGK